MVRIRDAEKTYSGSMGQKGYVPDPGSATLLGRYRYHGDFSPTLFCMIALIHNLTPTSAYLGQMQQLK
jgi:hypothetical protein